MALTETNTKVWTDLSHRRTQELFPHHFDEHVAPGRTFTNVLSVGPGDCSIEKMLLNTSLQQVEKLFLVEPDEKFGAKSLIQAEGHACQVEGFDQSIVDYNHEGPKLDLILVSHCLYYFYHQGAKVLAKLRSWLTEEGIVVIILNNSQFLYKINDLIIPGDGYKIAVTEEELEEQLTTTGFKFTFSSISNGTWDMAGFEEDIGAWVGYLSNKLLNQDEIQIAKKIHGEYCRPGTSMIPRSMLIAVCHL